MPRGRSVRRVATALFALAAPLLAPGGMPGAGATPATGQAQGAAAPGAAADAAEPYWAAIAEKRRIRFEKRRNGEPIVLDDYVLAQPPAVGRRPPSAPDAVPKRKRIPVVADFLAAARAEFGFVPQRPQREAEFKRAYARAATAAGLTREQAVRIYAFELGGNGTYDMQAGLTVPGRGRPISTALGYNQLLIPNTIGLLAQHGEELLTALRERAGERADADRAAFLGRIAALQRMIGVSRSVPLHWNEHERLAETAAGIGLHALNLDIDIGPLLQAQKLRNSLLFVRMRGHERPLSGAELELLNLTGDGNGFDMLTMPPALRALVPTANFFRRGGYERNSIARRHNVVARLLAAIEEKMDRASARPGAQELAAAFQAHSAAAK
jgi:hypothetical protein